MGHPLKDIGAVGQAFLVQDAVEFHGVRVEDLPCAGDHGDGRHPCRVSKHGADIGVGQLAVAAGPHFAHDPQPPGGEGGVQLLVEVQVLGVGVQVQPGADQKQLAGLRAAQIAEAVGKAQGQPAAGGIPRQGDLPGTVLGAQTVVEGQQLGKGVGVAVVRDLGIDREHRHGPGAPGQVGQHLEVEAGGRIHIGAAMEIQQHLLAGLILPAPEKGLHPAAVVLGHGAAHQLFGVGEGLGVDLLHPVDIGKAVLFGLFGAGGLFAGGFQQGVQAMALQRRGEGIGAQHDSSFPA